MDDLIMEHKYSTTKTIVMNISQIYDRRFFKAYYSWQSDYATITCTEDAEHFPELFADVFVDNRRAHSNWFMLFLAATSGQGGHHHINERPYSYWTEKFSQRKYELHKDLTYILRNELAQVINTVWWFLKNSLVYQVLDPKFT